MMFRPRESHDLRLLRSRLEITPRPADLRWLHDPFDNSVAIATFDTSTVELRFDSVVALEHLETTLPDYPLEEDAKTYPFQYSDDELPNLSRALSHHYPSDEVRRWVDQFLDSSGKTGTMNLLRSITLGIKKDFLYTRRSEKGVQSPNETLESRRGSCRDFAVLMMGSGAVSGIGRTLRERVHFCTRRGGRQRQWRRCDARVGAGLPPGRGLARFRSDQQYCGESQSDSCCRRLGSQASSPVVGHLHRCCFVIPRHGSHRECDRGPA